MTEPTIEPKSREEKFDRGYRAGVIAAQKGKAKSDNPYYHNTPEWQGWEKGFKDTSGAKT